jgi:hypothetical protein
MIVDNDVLVLIINNYENRKFNYVNDAEDDDDYDDDDVDYIDNFDVVDDGVKKKMMVMMF